MIFGKYTIRNLKQNILLFTTVIAVRCYATLSIIIILIMFNTFQ